MVAPTATQVAALIAARRSPVAALEVRAAAAAAAVWVMAVMAAPTAAQVAALVDLRTTNLVLTAPTLHVIADTMQESQWQEWQRERRQW